MTLARRASLLAVVAAAAIVVGYLAVRTLAEPGPETVPAIDLDVGPVDDLPPPTTDLGGDPGSPVVPPPTLAPTPPPTSGPAPPPAPAPAPPVSGDGDDDADDDDADDDDADDDDDG